MLTFDTGVGGLDVGGDVLGAGLQLPQTVLEYAEGALPPPGAARVHVGECVERAPKVAVVALDAAPERHAAVLGGGDDDDLVRAAARLEVLPRAVVVHLCGTQENEHRSESSWGTTKDEERKT